MNFPSATNGPRFELGRVVSTKGAIALLLQAGITPISLLKRHVRGDWGEIDATDVQSNEDALSNGSRLMSVYDVEVPFPDSARPLIEKLWVITEADRSVTTLLLPEEY